MPNLMVRTALRREFPKEEAIGQDKALALHLRIMKTKRTININYFTINTYQSVYYSDFTER